MSADSLEMADIDFGYTSSAKIIRSFSLTAKKHDFIALLGPSGSGKSTLLRLMAGLLRPQCGKVLRNGTPVNELPPERRKIGIVFQGLSLFPNLTVEENIAFGPRQTRQPRDQIQRTVDDLLHLLQIAPIRAQRPRTLSGGQAQRVAIARALALETEVLLLDEPFSNLDRTVADISSELIRSVHAQRGLTTVLVTHDRHYALSLANRVIVLSATGQILEVGTPESVYRNPQTLEGARLTGRILELPARVSELSNGIVTLDVAGGRLHAGACDGKSIRIGQAVVAAVRPECIEMANRAEAGGFTCKMVRSGSIDQPFEVVVAAPDGTELTASIARQSQHPQRNQEVTLRIRPEDIHCFSTGADT